MKDHNIGSQATIVASQMLSIDAYGNPSYTVKDGGTLKKKLQPYAADKTARDGLNIPKDRLNGGTAPGQYKLAGDFDVKPDPMNVNKKKTANERLRDLGLFPPKGQHTDSSQINTTAGGYQSQMSANKKGAKKNYYAQEGIQDYLIGETELTQQKANMGPLIDQRELLKPVTADMMKRVRGTAKWS